ncbi:hypothetical protein [Chitinolyticbacter meiyuanensis]|uniref:hypothetical protein n=1 Tax=Chitinolyticbacter meiyuanensis TaxID=682798 RepID=UPI0011E5E23A|nr:hypothetical protein [Chitinolyticbacter meiyuanensis]
MRFMNAVRKYGPCVALVGFAAPYVSAGPAADLVAQATTDLDGTQDDMLDVGVILVGIAAVAACIGYIISLVRRGK